MRRWIGDRFVGKLEDGEEPPLMDVVSDGVRKLERIMAEATWQTLTSTDRAPHPDPRAAEDLPD